jgi:hypothetical protein
MVWPWNMLYHKDSTEYDSIFTSVFVPEIAAWATEYKTVLTKIHEYQKCTGVVILYIYIYIGTCKADINKL